MSLLVSCMDGAPFAFRVEQGVTRKWEGAKKEK